jgi:hypothetical protein
MSALFQLPARFSQKNQINFPAVGSPLGDCRGNSPGNPPGSTYALSNVRSVLSLVVPVDKALGIGLFTHFRNNRIEAVHDHLHLSSYFAKKRRLTTFGGGDIRGKVRPTLDFISSILNILSRSA